MAYNLLAEADGDLDFAQIQRELGAIRRFVELVPVLGPPRGVGLSVPGRVAHAAAVDELERMVTLLRGRHHLRIHDLFSGAEVTPEGFAEVKVRILADVSVRRPHRLHGSPVEGARFAELLTQLSFGGRPRCEACGEEIESDQGRGTFLCRRGCTAIQVDHVSPYGDDEE